jgi:hypothetical protein
MAGDEGRPTLAPLAAAPLSGEEGRGEDYSSGVSIEALNQQDSDGAPVWRNQSRSASPAARDTSNGSIATTCD